MAEATGEASDTKGGMARMLAVVATAAVVAVNPEVVEVAVAAEEAWAEVTIMAAMNLVALGNQESCHGSEQSDSDNGIFVQGLGEHIAVEPVADDSQHVGIIKTMRKQDSL